jgi:hypothetical protein
VPGGRTAGWGFVEDFGKERWEGRSMKMERRNMGGPTNLKMMGVALKYDSVSLH